MRRSPKDEKFFTLELNWDFVTPPTGLTLKTPWLDAPKIGKSSSSSTATPPLGPPPLMFKMTPLVPRICTPADPKGDQGEADARSAFIYGWLKYRAELEQKQAKDLLEKYGAGAKPMGPPKNAPSVLTPMFEREDGADGDYDPHAVKEGVDSPGRPLEPGVRRDMEAALGHDFSKVLIHADAGAARSSTALQANAFTVGRDVVFGAGKYAPGSVHGRRLLAHELAHVVQQNGAAGGYLRPAKGKNDPAEQEARTAGENVSLGRFATIRSRVTPQVQRAPDADTGVRTQFVDPGQLTRYQIMDALWRMAYLFDSATSTSIELADVEQKALPRYVEAFVRLSRAAKLPPTLPGLDPAKEGHQKVLRLLPAAPADQTNFLEAPKPPPPAAAPAVKTESALEKFVRAHAKEIGQLPQWNQNFANGLKASPLSAKLGESWEQLKRTLTSVDSASQFYFGFVTGVPIGAVKDIYGQFKDAVEALLKAYLFSEKMKVDPLAALRDVRQFGEGLAGKLLSLFDPNELGIAIGFQLAKKIDGSFVKQNAEGQGRFFGEQVGMVLMEVALLFIGVEEVSAAAKALSGSKVGTKVAEGMSIASKELKVVLEARGVLKGEAKVATAAAKDARALESATKDAAALGEGAKPGAVKTAAPPADPYDVAAWMKYYEENPKAKRSVGAAQADDPHAFVQDKGTNVPPEKPAVEVEARARGGAIERQHLDSMPEFSRPKEHDFPGIDGWKGGRDATRDTNAGRMRIISGADVLQIKSVGSANPTVVRARVREGIAGLDVNVFEKGSTRVVNPASRRLDVLFEEGVLSEVTPPTKALLTNLAEEAGNRGVETRWFRFSAGSKIRIPIP